MKKELHGLNNKKIQVTNRSLVLDIIIRKGIISRKELADLTGLGKPTITNVVNELLEFDIVEERESLSGSFLPDGSEPALKRLSLHCPER